VRASGLLSADARELAEMLYQFEEPFVMDSSYTQALLGLAPTPLESAAQETVRWWQDEQAMARS
jgi:nucleoside-diphosphate-sugar epimerase